MSKMTITSFVVLKHSCSGEDLQNTDFKAPSVRIYKSFATYLNCVVQGATTRT